MMGIDLTIANLSHVSRMVLEAATNGQWDDVIRLETVKSDLLATLVRYPPAQSEKILTVLQQSMSDITALNAIFDQHRAHLLQDNHHAGHRAAACYMAFAE